jgi:phosphopantothenoylcysteine decarboxylase / phosphopantothenate---cysteine ligase
MKQTIVLGITGGIAAYKMLDLINLLKKADLDVHVMMTYGATKIVSPQKLAEITGNHVYTNIFQKNIDYQKVLETREVDHIELAKKADLMMIAPATANVIAKLSTGLADDYVTTTVLAARSSVMICPSMNTFMWQNPATQKNIETLRAAGYIIIEPDSGILACGDEGEGKLPDVHMLQREILALLAKRKVLTGKKILVTAGGTHEYIDDVRYIANKSSGKMGIAIAEAAYMQGADVLLIRSATAVKPRYPMQEKVFETAEELEKILEKEVPHADFCFHTAAVSDFSVQKKHRGKVSSDLQITLTLEPKEKLLNKIKIYNPNIFLVGFKAAWSVSDEELIAKAQEAIKKSHADMIVANDVGKKDQGFSVDTNAVVIVDSKGRVENIPLDSKRIIGEKIISYVMLNSFQHLLVH